MEDVFKPAGPLSSSKPEAGGAPVRNVPLFGIVKDNIDPNKSGRIFVYISDNSGKDPESRDSWTPVSYLSPFYGKTKPSSPDTGYGTYINNPISYGEWHSPPDIGTTVICFFVNGDMNYGFYIGAIPDPEALQMVPAIGATENIIANSGEGESYGGATLLPVTNINSNNSGIADSPLYLNEAKPIHSYAASTFFQQGLLRDPVRGPITTSAQRESPSRVGWGVNTPGRPIYEGGFDDESVADAIANNQGKSLKVVARRAGHSFVMDDGDVLGKNQLIRLRSTLGHQLLMSDDGQTFFIIHANGQSYIELGKEGTVDIYSTNSINLRTQGDLNLHADRNVNIQATKDLKIRAENISIESDKATQQRVGTDFKFYTLGKLLSKAEGAMSFESAGDSSFLSTATTFINGSKINLNTGQSGTKPIKVDSIALQAHTDTLYDSSRGFLASPGKLISIVSRAPAHTPWANAGQGVNIKVDLNADSNLPPNPTPTVENTNTQAESTQSTPPNAAQTSTIPVVPPVSASIDSQSTSAVLGSMAQNAALGPSARAVLTGAAPIIQNGVPVAQIGSFAQTPQQLQQAGILKPGSAGVINSLVAGGTSIQRAMTPNMFTGRMGVTNLGGFVNNPVAQAMSVVNNLQLGQRALTTAGLITGKESPTQIAGMVMSSVTQGLRATTNIVRTLGPLAPPGLANATSGVMKAIGAGNNAVNMIKNVNGALGSLSNSVNALSKAQGIGGILQAAKGVSASAFFAIRSTMKPLIPGVPQNLKALKKISEAQTAVTGALNTATNLNRLVNVANSGTPGLAAVTAAVASGISNMPGGLKGTAAVINRAAGAVNSVPGVSGLTNIVNVAVNAAFGGRGAVRVPGGANGLKAFSLLGLGPSQAAQLAASVAALATGSQSIKLPSIGLNTTNRSAITTQTVAVLGDQRIPAPNYGSKEITSYYERETQKLKEKTEQIQILRAESDKQYQIALQAKQEWIDAKNNLPQGDEKIEEAKQKFIAELKKWNEIAAKLSSL